MLYELILILVDYFSWIGAFGYITTRVVISLLFSFFIGITISPCIIVRLKQLRFHKTKSNIHMHKHGIPSMGGFIILFSTIISVILWADLSSFYIWVCLFTLIAFAVVGGLVDFLKIYNNSSKGLNNYYKVFFEFLIALLVLSYVYINSPQEYVNSLYLPFLKDFNLAIGVFGYLAIGIMIMIGSSNAISYTDGLDGLVIVPVLLVVTVLSVYIYISGNTVYSDYLHMLYIPNIGELSIFCGAILGSGLAFLWFNSHPAQVFMGDIGSVSLGAVLALFAILVRQEVVFLIVSGVFVIEALSVLIQRLGYRFINGKRIFKMAPLHHHYELSGIYESKVVIRFWIASIILALIGLIMLKLR